MRRPDAGARDVWIIDLTPGAVPRRVTADSASDRPEWTADGKRVVYRARATGRGVLMVRSADGDGEAKPLLALSDREIWHGALSPDERTVVYRTGTVNGADVWYQSTVRASRPGPAMADISSTRSASRIVRATVRTAPEFNVVSREVVLTGYDGEDGVTGFDVAANGRDFVIKDLIVDGGRIVVVHGWTRELRERFTGGTP